ncbi:hypothetical protein [Streptomyces sp. NPDC050538]|uniref:hypothetical protein n=1 Tax=Streptomyces sp. NPDC050538 TaxID=3365627 RepID=UPI0037BD7E6A
MTKYTSAKCASIGLVGTGLVRMLTGDAYAELEAPLTTWCGARVPGRQNRGVAECSTAASFEVAAPPD